MAVNFSVNKRWHFMSEDWILLRFYLIFIINKHFVWLSLFCTSHRLIWSSQLILRMIIDRLYIHIGETENYNEFHSFKRLTWVAYLIKSFTNTNETKRKKRFGWKQLHGDTFSSVHFAIKSDTSISWITTEIDLFIDWLLYICFELHLNIANETYIHWRGNIGKKSY